MQLGRAPLVNSKKNDRLEEMPLEGQERNETVELIAAMLDTAGHEFLLDDGSTLLGVTVCTLYLLPMS